ncbi:LacI family DNA-binding transcriptional regulator [Pseudooceanicola sp. CBS1P-1]|uniref:Substrate-binding domain-containing protein n=1 Tax=Pseudooceanicola albus TaxID=2692189 RepID=A0A6L7G6P8_9RHOB|nr:MULTISPECIES: LacI family DNA-binding transcriptional regulator [Pseudooceanicola]MBT9386815.1 LacI family DNA-binding transcriptional regulator [Pseudooceanicola endophyticus]MXN19362.1 substrate-binding domain-containing protein [Pseudooceanicola albus]
MNRPTIADLAEAAGVSVSTVNRILNGKSAVRSGTVERVQAAAEEIGFYGLGTIEERLRTSAPTYKLGFLLQQSSRELYQLFGRHVIAACRRRQKETIHPLVDFVDLLTPENIAARLLALGRECDAVALIAADHPVISQAIRTLREEGKPVVAYISDHSAPEKAAYVGTDNWKLGRTAAWFVSQMTHGPGRVAVFIGNHRYQCQDVAEASFRSYIREHAPELVVEDSRPTHEEGSQAYAMLSEILRSCDDLKGILIVGGGISGIMRALREIPPERRRNIRLICRDIGPETRKGLSEGLITAALCHPLEATSDQLVQTMIDVTDPSNRTAILQRTLPLEIVTPESI